MIWTNLKGHIYHAESTADCRAFVTEHIAEFELGLSKLVSLLIIGQRDVGAILVWSATRINLFQIIKSAKVIWTSLKGHIYYAENIPSNDEGQI